MDSWNPSIAQHREAFKPIGTYGQAVTMSLLGKSFCYRDRVCLRPGPERLYFDSRTGYFFAKGPDVYKGGRGWIASGRKIRQCGT